MLKMPVYSIILYTFVFNVLYAQDYTIRDVPINGNGETHKYRNFMQVDHDGFLWYSTYSGLVKDFESHNVLSSFIVENPNDLVQGISRIYFDTKQRIWASADTGLFLSRKGQDDSFNRIELKPFLMGRELETNSFMEDCNGNLWMVAATHKDNIILKVDSSLEVTKYKIEGIEPRYTNDRYYLRNFLHFERRVGCDKFLVRQGRKLYIFDAGTTTPIADYTSSIKYSLADYTHPEWHLNGGDGLVLTDNGDVLPESMETQYTYEGEVFETYFIEDLGLQLINVPFQEMIPITEDDNPILKNHADLIAINGPGKTLMLFKLVEINGSLHLKKTYDIPFPFFIEDLIIDKNDIIYVSNYDRISKIKFNKNRFDRILNANGEQNIDVKGFLELPNKEILAASNKGVFKLSPTSDNNYDEGPYKTENVFPTLHLLRSFLKASDSTAWCLGVHKALWEINFLKNTIVDTNIFYSHRSLANLHYFDILKHSDSTFLLASDYGLQEFNFKQKKFRELPIPALENAVDPIIRALLKIKNKLYIGTDMNGLIIQDLDSNAFLHLSKDSTNNRLILPSNKVQAILIDRQKKIWLGTDKGAVCLERDLKKATVIDGTYGLTNVNVVGILEDADENIWFSTRDGLYRYEKSSKKVTAFYVEDGLPFNDFNLYSYYKTSTNTLLFGGVRGLIAFDSIDDPALSQDIRMFPTKFEYYDTGQEKDVELYAPNAGRYDFDLPYSKNSFSITYSINDCYNTETNKYAYKLEGFTEDWVNLGNQNTLNLLSIPPGDYVLRIKGSNPAGVESSNELRYDIHVAQVFYKRPWIQAVTVLFLLGLVALALHNRSVRQQEEKIHKLKQRFFTNISHEIRTPLTLILGTINHLLKGNFNAEEQRQLTTLKSSTGRLRNLVNELLNIRRLETGNIKLKISENNLVPFVYEIFLAFSQQAITNGIGYHFKNSQSYIPVWFDKTQLEKTIYNLLTNAFKFTSANDTITVEVAQKEGQAHIRVEDSGQGIPEDKLHHIFERFYQNEDSISENLGFGIGLSISKDIVELHSGTIQVKSTLGQGSCFNVILPLGDDHVDPLRIVEHRDEEDFMDIENRAATDKVSFPMDKELSNSIVLVVEDNQHLREYLRILLSKDFKVLVAPDGKIGLELALELSPDLILSDVMMPVKDGITLCYELKTNIMTSHIPVILLTARAAVENIMEGYETGADDYLVKPFDEEVLRIRIKNLLNNRKQLREKYVNEGLLHPKEITLTSPDQEFLGKLNAIIEENIEEPEFQMDRLALDMAMSHSSIYKKLKALTGMTIIGFIKDFRLRRAAQMLGQHKFSITDISFKVGYMDRKHFSQEFKKKFGKTPSEYAKEHLDKT
jgi:signal transduction histidine kinase/DNA-binding response OmpR family regulator